MRRNKDYPVVELKQYLLILQLAFTIINTERRTALEKNLRTLSPH